MAGENTDKRTVLLIAVMGGLLVPFMSSSIVVALPAIGSEFAISTVLLNWIATSFILTSAIFVVPFGRLADIFGSKRIYLYGVITFSLASVLCSLSINIFMLLAFRVLQGIGGAMMFGTGTAMLTSVYPPGERGRVLGINVSAIYVGLSVGPFLGGLLTQHLGWRSIFFINVPVGILVIIMIMVKLKQEWAEAAGESFDLIGTIIYGIGLFGLMCGLSLAKSGWSGIVMMLVGTVAVVIFVRYEMKVKNPVLEMSLFRNNRVLTFSTAAALMNYSAIYAVSYLLSLYLQYIKGYDPQEAGLVLIASPVVQALLAPVAGKLSDRIEPQKVASIGMALSAAGLGLFALLGNNTGIFFILSSLVLLGFGSALFSSPNTNAIMSSVERKYYGVTSGLVSTARVIGQNLSMGVTTLVFAIYIGNAQISREYHPYFLESIRIVFVVLSLFCLAGIFASLARGKMHG